MRRGSGKVHVRWHMVTYRPGSSVPEHWIGKWLLCCDSLGDFLPKTSALCVVDDFGDLVAVPMRAPA